LSKNWRIWLGLIISLLLIYLVVRNTDPAELAAALAAANYWWLVPAMLVYFVGVWLRAWRWRFLLRSIKPLPVGLLFRTIIIGYMANNILPFRLGEIVRAYALGAKGGVSKAATLTTIVVERVMDGLTMVGFMVVASLLLPLDQTLRNTVRLSGLIFLVVVVVLFAIVASRRLADALVRLFLRPFPRALAVKLEALAASFLNGLGALRSPRDLAGVLVFSVLGWLPESAMYALIGAGFGLGQPFAVYMLTTAAGNLGAMVPSTPGYIGVFDAPAKYVLVLSGVADGLATSFTLVLHAALLMPVILLGFVFLWQEGLSLRGLQQQQPKDAHK
jgi:uncharacterized protein (TIRG00374 family)